jgi:hypothetical protein
LKVSNKRRWDILSDFECRQKAASFKKLTIKESLCDLENLYRFAQEVTDKKYYRKINLERIQALSKAHSLFMKVKP